MQAQENWAILPFGEMHEQESIFTLTNELKTS